MKKFTLIIAVIATLVGNGAYAQPANNNNNNRNMNKPAMSNTGAGAQQAGTYSSNNFAWGVGLVGFAVIGTVVGLTVAAATHSPSTFSH